MSLTKGKVYVAPSGVIFRFDNRQGVFLCGININPSEKLYNNENVGGVNQDINGGLISATTQQIAHLEACEKDGKYVDSPDLSGDATFKKGDYIVVLKSYKESYTEDFVYKQRRDFIHLSTELDNNNDENGLGSIKSFNNQNWRRATESERAIYEKIGKPFNTKDPLGVIGRLCKGFIPFSFQGQTYISKEGGLYDFSVVNSRLKKGILFTKGEDPRDICNRNNCIGIIEERDSEQGCQCPSGNPPCSHCVDDRRFCPVCGWEGSEEETSFSKISDSHEKAIDKLPNLSTEPRGHWSHIIDYYKKKRTRDYIHFNASTFDLLKEHPMSTTECFSSNESLEVKSVRVFRRE